MTRAMHEKITCRTQTLTPTTAGEQQEIWQDIATVWAEVISRSGDVTQTARQKYISTSFTVRTRYQDRLLASRNILWQGREYRVVSLRNPDNRKRILELEILEDTP